LRQESRARHNGACFQDVFVLQLDGVKDWTVYHVPVVAPFNEHMVGRPGSDDPTGLVGFNGAPHWQGQLVPGDLLYIPRGWVHEARTGPDGPSMHLTITANSEGHRSVACARSQGCAPAMVMVAAA
jgi:ribosomal protein L16 Arg81 hydroxylase